MSTGIIATYVVDVMVTVKSTTTNTRQATWRDICPSAVSNDAVEFYTFRDAQRFAELAKTSSLNGNVVTGERVTFLPRAKHT